MNRDTNTIKIASLNVNGVSDRNRMRQVITQMRTEGVSILTLQDTHVSRDRALEYVEDFPGLGILAAVGHDGRAGVMIIVDETFAEFDGDVEAMNEWGEAEGRVLVAAIKTPRENLVVGCVYAPPTLGERIAWGQTFTEAARENFNRRPGCDFVCGDWNMTTSREDSNADRQVNQEDLGVHLGCLRELMRDEMDSVDGWRVHYPNERVYTHRNTALLHREDVGKSRIDRIYVRTDWYLGTQNWMIIPLGFTDHSMITADYCPVNPLFGKGRWRAHPALVESADVIEECRRILVLNFQDHMQLPLDQMEQDDCNAVLESWETAKDEIQAMMITWRKELLTKLRSRKHTLRMQAQQSHRSERQSEALLLELKELEEDDRKDYCHNAFVKEYILGERPNAYFYEKVKAMKGKGNTIRELTDPETGLQTSEPDEMLAIVQQFYQGLYDRKPSDAAVRWELFESFDKRITADFRQKLEAPISGSEIRAAIRRGKQGRSPGEDGLPLELYKNITTLGEDMEKILKVVLNAIREAKRLPAWFKRGCLSLLYKRGDPFEIRNYRPLSIMGADYRLYTSILSHRLVQALEMVISDHQTAFLPGRLIGDNVKLVQCVIEKYKNSEEEAGILFLDQEKAYDRVSHVYLWECMRRAGLPRRFINRIKALYVDGTVVPYLNGHKGEIVLINCGVRQGDALSCILYDLVIEPLAMTIRRNRLLLGIKLQDGTRVKCVLYADDTTFFPRSIEEMREMARILHLFEQAVGALVNWIKSWFLALGTMRNDQLPFPVQVIEPGTGYVHLGIPVGVDIAPVIAGFWEKMIGDLQESVERWIKARLSQRARVRVATTLLVSVVRYAIFHLLLSKKNENIIEKLQQRLIWGGRAIHLGVENQRLPNEKGGLGSQDLGAIRTAAAIAWVARMEKRPELPWVQLAIDLCLNTRSVQLRVEQARTPWKQVLNSVGQNVAKAPSMAHIWPIWWKELGGHPGDFDRRPLTFVHPGSAVEVLNTNFWYFPRIFEGGQLNIRGTGVWATDIWGRMAAGEFGALTLIGDIYDPVTRRPRELGNSPTDKSRTRRAITTLMGGVPQRWKDLLETAAADELRQWNPGQQAYQHCKMSRITAAGNEEWKNLNQVSYPWAYRVITEEKVRGSSLNDRIAAIVTEMSRKLHRIVRATELWKAIECYERVPKANDLLYRLMLDVVETGEALTWETLEAQTCPLDETLQTIEHVWIECEAATEIWGEFERIYNRAARGRSYGTGPTNRRDLVGLFALGPGLTNKFDLIRWHILYSEAVWQIWKLYCNNQYRSEPLTPVWGRVVYRKAVLHRIMMDRALTLSPKRETNRRHNIATFTKVWGESPLRVLNPGGPVCLG